MELDTFEDRYEYGKKAEDCYEVAIKSAELKIEQIPYIEERGSEYNKTNGDFYVQSKLRIEVKRNSISINCILGFEGDLFVIYNHFLTEAIVIKKEDMKQFIQLQKNWVRLSSGDEGLKFKTLKEVAHISLKQHIENLKNV